VKKKLFTIILVTELICILFLIWNLYRKNNVVVTPSLSFMSQNKLVFRPIDNLKYFYEPTAHTKVKIDLHFLGDDYNRSITYIYNSDTLHQNKDTSVQKNAKTFRILTLGDSFTFGSNLNTDHTYPSQLQQLLNTRLQCQKYTTFEVLNLAVPGYDTQYNVQRFKLRGEKYNADVVLWFFIPDDFLRLDELMTGKMRIYGKAMKQNG
jgi:hypothetical protein